MGHFMKTKYGHVAFAGLLSVVAGCGGGDSGTPGTGGSSVGGNSGSGGSGGSAPAGSGGSAPAGSGGSSAGSGPAGGGGTTVGQGGQSGSSAGAGPAGSGGSAAGASGRGGSAGSAAGTGGGAAGRGGAGGSGVAGTGGGSSVRYTCPQGPFTAPSPSSITPTKIAGVPPLDSFNNNGNNFGNIEGAVWFDGAIHVSEIGGGNNPPPARILRITTAGAVSIAFPNSGTNGLAIDTTGRLIGANHVGGGLYAYNLTGMTSTPIVPTYNNTRFNSPNDITVHSNGTIYFTDPDYQAPTPRPQSQTRVYRVPPGTTTPMVVDMGRSNPNGVTLSLDEMFLFVTDGQGLHRYPVNADGSTGTATRIAQNDVFGGDGMGIDCAGNLYVTSNNQVIVVNPTGNGTLVGRIMVSGVQSCTNVAFGGANHQTLYITGLGNGMGSTSMGIWRADLPLPGMPF
jgi:gluconolactonase